MRVGVVCLWGLFGTGCGAVDSPLGEIAEGLTLGNLEQSQWSTCSLPGGGRMVNCANGKAFNQTSWVQGTFGGRANAAQIWVGLGTGGQRTSYGGAYWYRQASTPGGVIQNLDIYVDFYVPSALASTYQALEFDAEQHLGGKIYNFAFQADRLNTGHWRTFDYPSGSWKDTCLAYSPVSLDHWHTFHAYYSWDGTYIHDNAVYIDGALIGHPSGGCGGGDKHVPANGSSDTTFNMGLQIDEDSAGDGLNVYYDNVTAVY
jgi:hypothetical protein